MLAEPPELNELDAERLRVNAVRAAEAAVPAREAARRVRRNRVLFAVSGIAACVLAVVGIAFATTRSNSSTASRVISSTPPKVQDQPELFSGVPSLGSYADVKSLDADALHAAQQRASAPSSGEAGTGASAPNFSPEKASVAAPPAIASRRVPALQTQPANVHGAVSNDSTSGDHFSYSSQGASTTTKSASKALSACSAAKFAGPGDELLMRATATLAGRPVQVYVFAGHGEHTVVVLGQGCALVTVQFVG
jgi:hypothetical protein